MQIGIIGAGASGLMSAIIAKETNKNLNIVLYEANNMIGKKILASGNGRCNISNENLSVNKYIGLDNNFVSYILENLSFNNFKRYCEQNGLYFNINEDGKAYPLSNEAKSVVKFFEKKIQELNIEVKLNTKIIDIEKKDNKFLLKSFDDNTYKHDKIIITSGLGAVHALGSNESGLDFAKNFGHNINFTYPSLVGLKLNSNFHHKLSGVKQKAKVSLYIDNTKEHEITDDILFTKYGISGFAILDISQYASYYISLHQKVELVINLFPTFERNKVLSMLEKVLKVNVERKVVDALSGIISLKLAPIIVELSKLDKEIKCKDINQKNIKNILNNLINLKVEVNGTAGFEHAEVSGGGILTSEINNKTLQSKLDKNLYFGGEILDIVGLRGGYNFHFAWGCGYLIGKHLANNK